VNSNAIFEAIELIASETGRLEKQALLSVYRGYEEFCRVLKAAYDPFVTYGIAKFPDPNTIIPGDDTTGIFTPATWDGLDALASRRMSGNAAREWLVSNLRFLSADSGELLMRILKKDLRAGITATTINKVIPGLIPVFDCMLAQPFEEGRIKEWPVAVEPKLDGVRVLAFVNGGTGDVRFFSRSGKEFTTFEHLKAPLVNVVRGKARGGPTGQWVFDGEIVSGSFNKTVSEVRRSSKQAKDAVFHVFDAIPTASFNSANENQLVWSAGNYKNRRTDLEEMLQGSQQPDSSVVAIPRYWANSIDEIHLYYKNVRARGLEGLIIKDPNAHYRRKRDYAWMKMKAEQTVDLPIVGAFEGEGKYAGMLGGLIVPFDKECWANGAGGSNHQTDDAVEVKVGGGFSDRQRKEFWEAYLRDKENIRSDELLGRIAEVEFHEVTPDGSLRHPRFVRFRDDKPLEEEAQ